MGKLGKKVKKQNGFTLMEMLIVVAIITVLISVSIPLVNNSLERAREATDMANERAAKAEFMIEYLTNEEFNAFERHEYDVWDGTLKETNYVTLKVDPTYGKCKIHKNHVIRIWMEQSGVVKMEWVNGGATAGTKEPHI